MKKLTELEYGVVIQALNNAMDAVADDNFIDPYGENPEGYTNEDFLQALESAETKIMEDYTESLKA